VPVLPEKWQNVGPLPEGGPGLQKPLEFVQFALAGGRIADVRGEHGLNAVALKRPPSALRRRAIVCRAEKIDLRR